MLTVREYDALERAILMGTRIAFRRAGSEFLIVPERLQVVHGREVIHSRHPSTGHQFEVFVDEIDHIEIVR